MCGNAEKRRSITIIKLISQENFFLYNDPLIHFTRRNAMLAGRLWWSNYVVRMVLSSMRWGLLNWTYRLIFIQSCLKISRIFEASSSTEIILLLKSFLSNLWLLERSFMVMTVIEDLWSLFLTIGGSNQLRGSLERLQCLNWGWPTAPSLYLQGFGVGNSCRICYVGYNLPLLK